jgi:hypothetical protein
MAENQETQKQATAEAVGVNTMVSRLIPPKRDKSYAYKMGYDCGKNGANTTNCHFSIFSSKENTKEWERGKKDAGAC